MPIWPLGPYLAMSVNLKWSSSVQKLFPFSCWASGSSERNRDLVYKPAAEPGTTAELHC